MKIQVVKGTGTGPTEISAFDQALVNAGIANFNLLYLSSVLPPYSEVMTAEKGQVLGGWGDKLYVVMAQKRTSVRNEEVWAGVGWIQDQTNKQGLLVEHEGHSEAAVKADIENSLKALAENRGLQFGPMNMIVSGTKCADKPVCALVAAVFQAQSW